MELVACAQCRAQTPKRFQLLVSNENVCPACAWYWANKTKFAMVREINSGQNVIAKVKVKTIFGLRFWSKKALVLEGTQTEIDI